MTSYLVKGAGANVNGTYEFYNALSFRKTGTDNYIIGVYDGEYQAYYWIIKTAARTEYYQYSDLATPPVANWISSLGDNLPNPTVSLIMKGTAGTRFINKDWNENETL